MLYQQLSFEVHGKSILRRRHLLLIERPISSQGTRGERKKKSYLSKRTVALHGHVKSHDKHIKWLQVTMHKGSLSHE